MTDDEIKKKLEIDSLQLDIRQKKTDSWLNPLKYILGAVGAIAVFYFVTKKDSSESIARERAKMIIEVLKEDDAELREQGLEVIKATYPSDDPWMKDIEKLLKNQALSEQMTEMQEQFGKWSQKKIEYENLRKTLEPTSIEFEINEVKIGFVSEKLNQISLKMQSIKSSTPVDE
jgi:hypothetical protein